MVPSQGIIFGLSFLAVVIAFAFAAYLYLWIKRQPVENRTIQDVSGLIKAGANSVVTFLVYKVVSRYIVHGDAFAVSSGKAPNEI